MTKKQLGLVRAWFRAYVGRFRDKDGLLPPASELKLVHSGRVAVDAERIASGSGWPEPAVRAASALGLLHDAGRFSQYAEFRTLRDAESVNHAERGAMVLSEENALYSCAPKERDEIIEAVRMHNLKEMPTGLSASGGRLLRLVRDADKLDIFLVVHEIMETGKYEEYSDFLLKVDVDGPPSEDFIAALSSHSMVNYASARTMADLMLLQLLWIYDINYPAAFRLIVERGVIGRVAARLPEDPRIRGLVAKTEDYCIVRGKEAAAFF